MAVNFSPVFNDQIFTLAGVPAAGYKLFQYAAGSTTKTNTYTTSAGNVANANPIILDSNGFASNGSAQVQIWLTAGTSYKFVLAPSTDTDPPGSPIRTEDNITGVNDTVTNPATEWVAGSFSGVTFISGTQFTVTGDQTSILTANRRLKLTVTASPGVTYGYISAVDYNISNSGKTTVTVTVDSGDPALDSGLTGTTVNYGLLNATNNSIPNIVVHTTGNETVAGNKTFSGTENFTGVLQMNSAAGTDGQVPSIAAGAAAMNWWCPKNYLSGLILSNDVSTPNTVLDISIGEAADPTNQYIMKIASAFTKNMNAVFVAGTGNGGLFSGTLSTSTWYHVFIIRKTADGSVDIYADTSVSGANVPSGWSAARRIGSIKTDGSSHIIPFFQDGDSFTWKTPVTDIGSNNPGTSAVSRTLASVPSGVRVRAFLSASLDNTSAGSTQPFVLYLSDLSAVDSTPAITTFSTISTWAQGVGNHCADAAQCRIFTDTSQAIRSRLSVSEANLTEYITVLGWDDSRGKNI